MQIQMENLLLISLNRYILGHLFSLVQRMNLMLLNNKKTKQKLTEVFMFYIYYMLLCIL